MKRRMMAMLLGVVIAVSCVVPVPLSAGAVTLDSDPAVYLDEQPIENVSFPSNKTVVISAEEVEECEGCTDDGAAEAVPEGK